MKVHTIIFRQRLDTSLEEAWDFFATPKNLNEITPPSLGFRILSEVAGKMEAGQIISYKIRLAPFIWKRWVTEITHCQTRNFFVDKQLAGPYKLWVHRHTFEEMGDGNGVLMTDRIDYAIGFGLIGEIAHKLFVRSKLEEIFSFRAKILADKFVSKEGEEAEVEHGTATKGVAKTALLS